MVVSTGDMQPFSLMPREVPNLQPCPLHLYHTSPLVKACWYVKGQSAGRGPKLLSLHKQDTIFYLGIWKAFQDEHGVKGYVIQTLFQKFNLSLTYRTETQSSIYCLYICVYIKTLPYLISSSRSKFRLGVSWLILLRSKTNQWSLR